MAKYDRKLDIAHTEGKLHGMELAKRLLFDPKYSMTKKAIDYYELELRSTYHALMILKGEVKENIPVGFVSLAKQNYKNRRGEIAQAHKHYHSDGVNFTWIARWEDLEETNLINPL